MPRQTPDRSQASPKRARGWWAASGLLAVGCLGVGGWLVPTLARDGHEIRTGGSLSLPSATSSSGAAVQDLPTDAAVPTEQQVRNALQKSSSSFHGGSITGQVVDAQTGRTIYGEDAGKAVKPASNLKILTAHALLAHTDPTSRFTTSARADGDHGVTLVAGGDTMLSDGKGSSDAVLGHAGLGDLAQETVDQLAKQGRSGRITVGLDETRFKDPGLSKAWASEDVESGFVTGVHAIALWDHHTQKMTDPESTEHRPENAAQNAWDAYVKALNTAGKAHGLTFAAGTKGAATKDAKTLASVQSATVQQQAQFMMDNSDNVLAEVLGRNAAVAAGKSGSQQDGIDTVKEVLEQEKVSTTGLHQVDLCGLGADDRVTPTTLAQTLAASTRSSTNTALLGTVLPVAGGSGTLAERFDDSDEKAARGVARAKTGTLLTVNSLSGTTVTSSGRVLAYSLIINDVTDGTAAKNTLDRTVSALTQL